jgi:hypothetical protein
MREFRFFVLIFLASALFSFAFASPSQSLQDSLDTEIENLASRRGLEIGGIVRSVMLRSAFSSPSDINAYDKSPDVERDGFSQLDLRLGVRPFDAVRATAILRLSAEYQDYFDFGHKSVGVPWVNIEGQISDKFYWVIGDFRGRYSPLTLYSPDVEVLYEPEIYARSRYMARDQMFLQGNNRNLQGANLQFRNDFGGTLGELRIEGIFSRLRRIEILDTTGYMGNILPSEPNTPGASQSSGMDKLLYTGSLEWLPLNKNLLLGFTPIFVQDLSTSKVFVYRTAPVGGICGFNPDNPSDCTVTGPFEVNPGVLGPEDAQVFSGRIGADIAGLIGDENFIANLTAEIALSKDKWYYVDENTEVKSKDLEGQAILAQIAIGYQNKNSWMARIDAKYIMNDSAWYNPLAQSPAFFARRVMNSDKDGDILKYGSRTPFYTTFDALYHFVPKFSPVAKSQQPTPDEADQTKSYNIAPFSKNSYNTAVYTRDEMVLLQALSDPILQGSLPNGLASANRVGPKADLTLGFGKENALEISGVFSMLGENKAAVGTEKAKFTEFGGGGKFDVGSLIWGAPLQLSGSYKTSTAERGSAEFKSDFINAGFYARYFKKFGFSAGFQLINTDNKSYSAYYPISGKQQQWMAGLDYTLAQNSWVAINFGRIDVTNKYAADGTNSALLPVYIEKGISEGTYMVGNEIEHKFQQNLMEASINVSF